MDISKVLAAHAEGFITQLLQPELVRHEKQLKQLIQDNAVATSGAGDGFTYCGATYGFMNGTSIGTLHDSMEPAMTAFLANQARLDRDTNTLRQYMQLLIKHCKSEQDLRDALPDSLIEITSYASRPRVRPEGWCVAGQANLQRQFAKLRDKIHYYLTLRLIY